MGHDKVALLPKTNMRSISLLAVQQPGSPAFAGGIFGAHHHASSGVDLDLSSSGVRKSGLNICSLEDAKLDEHGVEDT
jgi:hypothetical protein